MKDIASKEIVLRVTGEVQEANIYEIEKGVLAGIAAIKTELVTDQDFGEAKEIVKSCKALEDKIGIALNEAVMSMETVAEVKKVAESLQTKLRETRLSLNKKVSSEEARRKSEITNGGITKVKEHLEKSNVAHAFSVNIGDINSAIKNKRSLEKMQEAVDAVVSEQITAIDTLETLFQENTVTISKAEEEYPGLFPDIKKLAVSSKEVVEVTITSRVNEFKFKQQQKEEAERKAKEAEALKANVEKTVEEVVEVRSAPAFKPAPTPSFSSPAPQPDSKPKTETLIVRVLASKKQEVAEALNVTDGVVWVSEGQ